MAEPFERPTADGPVGNLGVRLGFAATLVAVLAAFLAALAAAPRAMEAPALGPVPLSLVLAAAMIAFAVALTGAYVLLANGSAR